MGLAALLRALRRALPAGAPLTLAYYPDGRQEALLLKHGAHKSVSLMHSMAYDANGPEGHSPMSLAVAALAGGVAAGLPAAKLTLGLPFYGRHSASGDWVTWEDLQQRHALGESDDSAPGEGGGVLHFNGRATIREKVRRAIVAGYGGVMIWEAGQDCRQEAVTRDGRTHGVTCTAGASSSLLVAMSEAIAEAGAAGGARAAAEL